MKAGNLLIALIVVFAALAGIVWVGRYGADPSVLPGTQAAVSDIPVPAESGPYPKAVAEETEYDFGTMVHGGKGSHIFKIRNEGEAPLELVVREEDSSCQCTVGKVGGNLVQPGESTEVELTWEIKSQAPRFEHWAKVRTNDPENQVIELRVKGIVGRQLVMKPSTTWSMGSVPDEPTTVKGTIHSEILDEFKVLDVKLSNPLLSAEVKPLDAEGLQAIMESDAPPEAGIPEEAREEMGLAEVVQPEAKCGYEITVTLSPGMPVGRFREEMKITTDVPELTDVTAYIEGTRTGPITIIPKPGQKVRWYAQAMVLTMGRFSAEEGKNVELSMFIRDAGEDFEIVGTESDLEFLTVSARRDADFGGQDNERYDLTIEVKPKSPPSVHNRSNMAKVTMKTNHPIAKSITLYIEFVSY